VLAWLRLFAGGRTAQALSIAWPLGGRPLWWLQLLSMGALVWLLGSLRAAGRGLAPRRLHGWLFSTTWLTGSFWWLFISMHTYGGLPAPLAAIAVLALAAALGLYYAVAAAWFVVRGPKGRVTGACLRRVVDARRTRARQLVHRLSVGRRRLCARRRAAGRAGAVDRRLRHRRGAALARLALALGSARAAPRSCRAGADRARVRLPQCTPRPDCAAPAAAAFRSPCCKATSRRTRNSFRAAASKPRCAGTANSCATPRPRWWSRPKPPCRCCRSNCRPAISKRSRRATASGTQAAIVGLPLGGSRGLQQRGARLPARRRAAYRYSKHHLVPFGEFIPPGFRWFIQMMNIPLGDFQRGGLAQAPFVWQGQRIAPNICYEDLFGDEIGANFRDEATAPTILLNVSNIAWFGDSVAIDEHLSISRMRSLEFARPMVRATNTGATVVIDAGPRHAPAAAPHARRARSHGRRPHGLTPYARWVAPFGLWPLWIAMLAIVGIAFALLAAASAESASGRLLHRPVAQLAGVQQAHRIEALLHRDDFGRQRPAGLAVFHDVHVRVVDVHVVRAVDVDDLLQPLLGA
jgi:apolipoprotein N-acyltransferase